jgi:hypothetical protein
MSHSNKIQGEKMATKSPALPDPQAEKLKRIHTIPALVKYLDEELG